MGKGKLLIAGVVFGILAIFAFIGVKSMLSDRKLVTQDTGYAPILPEGTGTPIAGTETGTGTLPSSTSPSTNPNLTTQDITLPSNTTNPSEAITLEGEQQETPTTPNGSTAQVPAEQLTTGTTSSALTGSDTNVSNPTTTTTPTNSTAQTASTTTVQTDTTPTTAMTEPTPTAFGKLGLTIVDISSPNGEIDGEFLVYDTDGVQVASYSGSETTNFSLPPGKYLAKVKANGKEASRLLEVYADKLTNARFEMPTSPVSTATTTVPQPQTQANPVATNANGQVFIAVRAAEGNRSIRSNIYVQKQNGQHVAKSNYVDGAEFSLEPGAYKITVKSEGRQEATRTIQVSANGIVRETIILNAVGNAPIPPQQAQPTVQPQPAPQQIQQGLLRLRLNTGEGLPDQARFVIRNRAGERVATVGPAPNGEINLPAGTYEVTAGIQGLRQSRMIEIGNGRVSEIVFAATEIIGQNSMPVPVPPSVEPLQQGGQVPQQQVPAQQVPQQQAPAQQNGGRLNLYAISGVDRKPMRVNFTVMTMQGQPIQSFNNVSSAELRVPPQPVQVRINYQSMNGTEVINVLPDQPTEYTFTISPSN